MDDFDMMMEDRLSGFNGFEMDDGEVDSECETTTEEDEDD